MDPAGEAAARSRVGALRRWLDRRLGGVVLALPATPGPAPAYGVPAPGVRAALLGLTCLAGLGGLPAVTVPGARVAGLPVGLCLLGAAGRDEGLPAAGALT
ncbi:hypothetical protein [Streptomyces sp. NPDC003717]|uniref:hypothetical protein n=1 Tax=Streptomyces sp. NPDC003717 TaxID=3154276 RepID=UPI0033BA0F1D